LGVEETGHVMKSSRISGVGDSRAGREWYGYFGAEENHPLKVFGLKKQQPVISSFVLFLEVIFPGCLWRKLGGAEHDSFMHAAC
jgi:hypothetical protein